MKSKKLISTISNSCFCGLFLKIIETSKTFGGGESIFYLLPLPLLFHNLKGSRVEYVISMTSVVQVFPGIV